MGKGKNPAFFPKENYNPSTIQVNLIKILKLKNLEVKGLSLEKLLKKFIPTIIRAPLSLSEQLETLLVAELKKNLDEKNPEFKRNTEFKSYFISIFLEAFHREFAIPQKTEESALMEEHSPQHGESSHSLEEKPAEEKTSFEPSSFEESNITQTLKLAETLNILHEVQTTLKNCLHKGTFTRENVDISSPYMRFLHTLLNHPSAEIPLKYDFQRLYQYYENAESLQLYLDTYEGKFKSSSDEENNSNEENNELDKDKVILPEEIRVSAEMVCKNLRDLKDTLFKTREETILKYKDFSHTQKEIELFWRNVSFTLYLPLKQNITMTGEEKKIQYSWNLFWEINPGVKNILYGHVYEMLAYLKILITTELALTPKEEKVLLDKIDGLKDLIPKNNQLNIYSWEKNPNFKEAYSKTVETVDKVIPEKRFWYVILDEEHIASILETLNIRSQSLSDICRTNKDSTLYGITKALLENYCGYGTLSNSMTFSLITKNKRKHLESVGKALNEKPADFPSLYNALVDNLIQSKNFVKSDGRLGQCIQIVNALQELDGIHAIDDINAKIRNPRKASVTSEMTPEVRKVALKEPAIIFSR